MYNDVRERLIAEALNSPDLLSDLAGLEGYLSESYRGTALPELIQNADDAGATRIRIIVEDDSLVVANDGRPFDEADFEALCRSAHSTKVRGQNIGYRGVGFKSTVSLGSTIEVSSGGMAATFDRKRSREVLGVDAAVPLIRIPHPRTESEITVADRKLEDALHADGFATIFRFRQLHGGAADTEVRRLAPTILLFLNALESIVVESQESWAVEAVRRHIDDAARSVELKQDDGSAQAWLTVGGDSALAFLIQDGTALPLTEQDALVHAFLPTTEGTGFGFRVNGDFSTDPARRSVVDDEYTRGVLSTLSDLYLRVLQDLIAEKKSGLGLPDLAAALIPRRDPSLAGFRSKSFFGMFVEVLRERGAGQLDDYAMSPPWLQRLPSSFRSVPKFVDSSADMSSLVASFGASRPTYEQVTADRDFSTEGDEFASDVAAHTIRLANTGQVTIESDALNAAIWTSGGERMTLAELQEDDTAQLDEAFIQDLATRNVHETDISSAVRRLTTPEVASRLIPQSEPADSSELAEPRTEATAPNVSLPVLSSDKRWRAAELLMMDVLNQSGWKLQDVSKQNLGYDLEGSDESGEEVFLEVKSVTRIGEPFSLTSNEYATATKLRECYCIAIVSQSEVFTFGLIRDPVSHVAMEKKIEKWVWNCSDYSVATSAVAYESD